MSLNNSLLLPSFFLLVLASLLNLSYMPVKAQTEVGSIESSGDAGGDQGSEDGGSYGQHVENPVQEPAGERSLEQEYDQHGVDWHAWAEKVAGALWDPLIENGASACGQSRVRWQVTSDCRVHIISVYSPIPDGAQVLVGSIKALDHNSILAFPANSKKTVVWRQASVGGRPIMHRLRGPIRVYP